MKKIVYCIWEGSFDNLRIKRDLVLIDRNNESLKKFFKISPLENLSDWCKKLPSGVEFHFWIGPNMEQKHFTDLTKWVKNNNFKNLTIKKITAHMPRNDRVDYIIKRPYRNYGAYSDYYRILASDYYLNNKNSDVSLCVYIDLPDTLLAEKITKDNFLKSVLFSLPPHGIYVGKFGNDFNNSFFSISSKKIAREFSGIMKKSFQPHFVNQISSLQFYKKHSLSHVSMNDTLLNDICAGIFLCSALNNYPNPDNVFGHTILSIGPGKLKDMLIDYCRTAKLADYHVDKRMFFPAKISDDVHYDICANSWRQQTCINDSGYQFHGLTKHQYKDINALLADLADKTACEFKYTGYLNLRHNICFIPMYKEIFSTAKRDPREFIIEYLDQCLQKILTDDIKSDMIKIYDQQRWDKWRDYALKKLQSAIDPNQNMEKRNIVFKEKINEIKIAKGYIKDLNKIIDTYQNLVKTLWSFKKTKTEKISDNSSTFFSKNKLSKTALNMLQKFKQDMLEEISGSEKSSQTSAKKMP